MKKIKMAVVGYGNRGQVYADYSLDEPNELEVVAIVDPNEYKLQVAKERYGLSDGQVFTCYADFVKSGIKADIVANATMDQYHYQTALEILNSKHDMLMEKPVVADKSELMDIYNLANANGCNVFVCHVLRYSPFYKEVKALIDSGKIGDIISMEMNEHVWVPHYLSSYGRGKWKSESECGSPILLAKCCHDMDLICWLNGSTPAHIASFGHRSQFVLKNKPEGATDYCYNCPHANDCRYSAMKLYYDNDVMPFLFLDSLNKPYEDVTKEERLELLKTTDFGKCAYNMGGDVVDRQNLIVDFEDGSVAAFTLSGGTCRPDRYIHVVGTLGEIEGKLEENKFVFRKYNADAVWYSEEVIDLKDKIVNKVKFGGHSGGDYGIMHDIVRYLNGERTSASITLLKDSIGSHLLVYGAEQSRKTYKTVKIDA